MAVKVAPTVVVAVVKEENEVVLTEARITFASSEAAPPKPCPPRQRADQRGFRGTVSCSLFYDPEIVFQRLGLTIFRQFVHIEIALPIHAFGLKKITVLIFFFLL